MLRWLPFLALAIALALSGCASRPPAQAHDACLILEDNRSWWRALQRTERRWGISPGVQLAILKRESSFNARARPARQRLLGVIPGSRPSSAYGYAQALDGTWDWYKRDTGNRRARRDRFADAVDFVGWYSDKSRQLSRIRLDDPYNLYLAYHEGHTGFNRRTYANKAWLQRAAREVETDTRRYDQQLAGCRRLQRRSRLFF
ncbi:hypothetical protein F1654_00155 [Alkalicaulis satelles]|uniref:Transglycosylase SLT domain-containing protein n=1 Tax=Alkalicaulis satelles TaxID=2609175 RepID=A0A5M6ZI05_9PROT|nr:hypothetical protein [Alkalicaulis satelles]KAA5804462.1 hypothetical protein F1654_00155 [Alkalicaulis satelles]